MLHIVVTSFEYSNVMRVTIPCYDIIGRILTVIGSNKLKIEYINTKYKKLSKV